MPRMASATDGRSIGDALIVSQALSAEKLLIGIGEIDHANVGNFRPPLRFGEAIRNDLS